MIIAATDSDFDQLWDFEQPAPTETHFRAELARAVPGSEAELQILTQIARTHSLRHNFTEAHAWLDKVEPKVATSTPKVAVRYALERGRAFNSAGDKERAKVLFVSAWEQASAAGLDFYAIDAAHMLAFVTPPAEQRQWNLKALALTERTGWALARCLRSLGRYDDALRRQFALRDDPILNGSDDGYVFEEIAENLVALNRDDEARLNFARAYALLKDDQFVRANESARLERMRTLGGVP